MEKENEDKAQKKLEREQKQTKAKLAKVEKLSLALEKAKKDVSSASKTSEACSSKQSTSRKSLFDSVEASLNPKTKCGKCKKAVFGTAADHEDWVGCETRSCNFWICTKCFPPHFDICDDFYCPKCEEKENN